MSIPEVHLAKFHKMTDAKEMWEPIKSRFSGNDESKKMQKYILKQQFKSFSVFNSKGLHTGYDRSLPASWSQVSLIMRTKPGVDTLSFDDLYSNLRVFESDVKSSTTSSSSIQNVAFISSESTSSTNDVSISYGVSTSSGHNSQREGSLSYTDELMYSFFANQSSGPYSQKDTLRFASKSCDLSTLVAFCSKRVEVCPRFLRFAQRNIAFCLDKVLRFAIEICIQNLLEVNPRTCLDALRTQFKEFFASKRVNSSEHLNQCWQKDFKEYMFCEPDTYRRDLLENLDTLEAVIYRAAITYGKLQLQSQDVQINLVQAVDDSLIVSKSSWIESENNNALSTSVNETQLQQHEITPYYLPKVREYVLAKPHHVIAPGSSRNSQEEPYGSNDMAHNHYLEEARKKTQERNMNSKPSVMHTTSLQNTTNGSKPNPRSNNQISRSLPVSKSSCGMSNGVSLVDHSRNSSSFSDSKHFVCSTCHKCVFNANHDNCITKFLKEVNSRAKVQSPKTRNINKPVKPKSHTQKPGIQIAKGQRFSPKKSSVVHEKPNTPKSCFRWKPTGRIFRLAGLSGYTVESCSPDNTTNVDSEPPNGSNDDITNPYECDQTLNVSAGPTNLSAGLGHQLMTPGIISSGLVPQPPSPTPNVTPTKNDRDTLFLPTFDEYFNPSPSVVQLVLVAVVQEPVISTGTIHQQELSR
ncbi:hypothetical protein Tco_0596843 [Tanacetum coccineum]